MMDDCPPHVVIDKPHEYRIVGLEYKIGLEDHDGDSLDMTLRRGDIVRRLRFLRPTNLTIESGFPEPTGGLQILDVRRKQWDGVKVQVTDFEGASYGAIKFLAADVIDLDVQA